MVTSEVVKPRTPRPRVWPTFLVAGFAVQAQSAGWEFEPSVSLATIYSDNIRLAPSGFEEEEFVVQVRPGFRLSREDKRLRSSVDYSLQYLDYADSSDSDQTWHQLNAAFFTELLRDRFFIDLAGGLSQQVVDPEVPFNGDNLSLTGNRTDAMDFSVAPYLTQSLGVAGDLLARYDFGLVEYDDTSIQDSQHHQASLVLDNERDERSVSWRVAYRYERQEFDASQESEFEELSTRLSWWTTGNFRVFGTAGVESDYQQHRSRAELDQSYWNAGIGWTVAGRDELEISFGERVFGNTYGLRWLRTRGSFSTRVSYSESAGTNSSLSLQSRRNTEYTGTEAGLGRPGDTDVFVRKRLEASVALERSRSRFAVTAFDEQREQRISADGVQLIGDEQSRGFGANFTWNLGSRTQLNAGVNFERSEFANGLEFDFSGALVGAVYSLGQKTSLRLDISRTQREPNIGLDFSENRVSLYLQRQF